MSDEKIIEAKQLKDYHSSISEFFPQILKSAVPVSMNQQIFLVELEARYEKFGDALYLSAKQLAWLLSMMPKEDAA